MVALHSFPTSSSSFLVFGEKNARRAKKYDEDQFNFQGINYGRILSLIIFLRCLFEKRQTRKRKRDFDHQAFLTASPLVSVFSIKLHTKKKCSEESSFMLRRTTLILFAFVLSLPEECYAHGISVTFSSLAEVFRLLF
jgi:hypothetical protein